jgi:uncharacterized protein YbcI
MPPDEAGADRSGESAALAARISSDAAQLFRTYTGNKPTRAQTTLDGETAYIVLRGTLSSPERKLVAAGHRDRVEKMRGAYQEAMRVDLIEMIERHLSRRVTVFVSAETTSPEVAVELFVLDGSVPTSRA